MKTDSKRLLCESKIVVFKLGSSLIVDDKGRARTAWLSSLAADCAWLREQGIKPVIVSSGAIALGRGKLRLGHKELDLREKQAASAVGQVALSALFQKIFAARKMQVAQMLLTNFINEADKKVSYNNGVNTLNKLLEMDVIPVINENDAIATEEIRFGDNDRLSAVVAKMAGADILFLLSDIYGLYDKDPKADKKAKLIEVVRKISDVKDMAGGTKNPLATGGMTTKLMAADICMKAGCKMVIMYGKTADPVGRLWKGEKCTWFLP